ncbi:serine protease 27-like [Brachionus plicatilis]|uniref:Serine protease 27-like n=1 Tax=Brachionus plicatilis TaxID=10195 RepID=A0A3M7QYT0_BRAPC|nr:serine protease 27-like [Brachionus plicatilis]
MSILIETNNTVYPVVPEANNYHPIQQKPATVVSQSKKVAKKSSKIKIIAIVSIIAVVVVIIIAVAVVLAVLLSQNCRYGKLNGVCIECGVTYSSSKIVGGQNAGYSSWPSIVYIQFKYYYLSSGNTYSISTSCAGTLVNQDTVVTAAHCYNTELQLSDGSTLTVSPNSYHATYESMYTVYLGLYDKSDLSSGVSRSVKSYTIHSNYDDPNVLNDIAIIKLSSTVDLSEKIQVSCLPEDSDIYPENSDIDAYIVGWGKTSSAALTTPDILQEALVTVYDSSKCSLVSIGTLKNWQSQICAGKYEGGIDTCQGDSGGPLFVKDTVDSKQKFILTGVTSYGEGCAEVGKPGIYTRVSAFIDWIEEKMNE